MYEMRIKESSDETKGVLCHWIERNQTKEDKCIDNCEECELGHRSRYTYKEAKSWAKRRNLEETGHFLTAFVTAIFLGRKYGYNATV